MDASRSDPSSLKVSAASAATHRVEGTVIIIYTCTSGRSTQ